MPRIESITPVYYQPLDPIHWEVDNLPLKTIVQRQELINLALDNVIEQMINAIGTQGSFSNRLNQSLNANGSLKTTAIDEANHSIESHSDTNEYVRMRKEESDKLANIASNATNLALKIFTDDSHYVAFNSGELEIQPSASVTPEFEAPNIVRFNFNFPESAAHAHYYGKIPVHQNLVDPDYIKYKIINGNTSFIEDSLRVYINGVRIFENAEVYVPASTVDAAWTLMSFTSDANNGTFELSSAIADDDVIMIDFDLKLTS